MNENRYDLVHFNFAIAKLPLDHAKMAGFTSQLEAVNRLAESSPGFTWTPADGEAGDAIAVFGSPRVLANMSTWRSIENLHRFTYEGRHGQALRRRRDWFEAPTGPAYVLWWVPNGHRPKWEEAKERLDQLAARGPTAYAFTFHRAFSPTGEAIELST